MRRLSSVLSVILLHGAINPAEAADEPRALIERALQAVGGAEAVKQRVAVRSKMRGKIYTGQPDQGVPIEGEMFESGSRSKMAFRLDVGGVSMKATVVMDGDKSWRDLNGHIEIPSKEEIESLRASRHQDRVTGLTALLSDKGFTLASLEDTQVDGRPARGVKVSYKGQPDTHLYFDKESGFLVKYAYRAKKTGDIQEALHETVLSDYREPDLASADEAVLREAKLDVTGPALLAFVRRQTPNPELLDKIRTLIRKLGDDTFTVREEASRELLTMGAVAVPLLREAAKSEDREVARRAQDCLRQIGDPTGKKTVSAAVRLLGLRKPAGTAEVLLQYLPGADASVADDVRAGLFAVAHSEDKPDPVLVRALEDKDPARRAAAAAVLGKDGGAYARQPGRRLFFRPPKIAGKHKGWIDGKLQMEMEMFDQQYFNAFDDKVFARP
jgi:hypothetical protein